MTELKKRIHDDKNGLDYVLVGDYYIPAVTIDDTDKRPIGMWGQLHKSYLKQYKPHLYNELLLSCKLHTVLADLNEQASERFSVIMEQMKEAEGITEAVKAKDAMEWVRQMNSIRHRAEEIVKHELIYC